MSLRVARLWMRVVVLSTLAAFPAVAENDTSEFDAWLAELRSEALGRKISPSILDTAFEGLAPIERVIELDRKQPESTMTFDRYLEIVVTPDRVKNGRRKLAENRRLLAEIRERYGVQPRFVVALWGIESNFGKRTGSYPVVHALATLAHDGRRSSFFRGELFHALNILDDGHIEPDRMLGSWAGAMGQPQFMPSSFRQYAVDHDGDARADIWHSTPDTLASAANYLSRNGWRGDVIWGREVRLPADFDPQLVGRKIRRPLAEWQALGVRRADGSDLPGADIKAAIVKPGGENGTAYVVYHNYNVILRWNRSDYFATAVGILADRIVSND